MKCPRRLDRHSLRHIAAHRRGVGGLEKEGDELRVRLGRFRRSLALPQYFAGLQPAWAKVEDSQLKIAFQEPVREG